MTLKIGVIADDFTGATDIASFLVLNGLKTVQLCGISEDLPVPDVEAVVISHKSRSCPVEEAIRETQASLDWLMKNGCRQIYFKYCSTFDSTSKGNIGPVTDALMDRLGTRFTIFQPALPVNGRTVYKGYLFVGDVLLEESGMKNHPITPMTDSSLLRLVEMQSRGKCGLVSLETVKQGPQAIRDRIAALEQAGFRYAVLDATDESDLVAEGEALQDMPLVTGGSGLAIGLARAVRKADADPAAAQMAGYPAGSRCAVLSGSCSVMTNRQVDYYRKQAASMLVDVDTLLDPQTDMAAFVRGYKDFIMAHQGDALAPLVYATANPEELARVQEKYGVEASSKAVETFFASLASALAEEGVERFIVAGGETSGIVTKALNVQGFYIGPAIAPGVPWVRSINNLVSLTLKSGNFGQEDFFARAQENFPVQA